MNKLITLFFLTVATSGIALCMQPVEFDINLTDKELVSAFNPAQATKIIKTITDLFESYEVVFGEKDWRNFTYVIYRRENGYYGTCSYNGMIVRPTMRNMTEGATKLYFPIVKKEYEARYEPRRWCHLL